MGTLPRSGRRDRLPSHPHVSRVPPAHTRRTQHYTVAHPIGSEQTHSHSGNTDRHDSAGPPAGVCGQTDVSRPVSCGARQASGDSVVSHLSTTVSQADRTDSRHRRHTAASRHTHSFCQGVLRGSVGADGSSALSGQTGVATLRVVGLHHTRPGTDTRSHQDARASSTHTHPLSVHTRHACAPSTHTHPPRQSHPSQCQCGAGRLCTVGGQPKALSTWGY